MTRTLIAGGGVFAAATCVLVLAVGQRGLDDHADPTGVTQSPEAVPSAEATEDAAHRGFLYGRVTMEDGEEYEGRLRWGGDEEAFWGDFFNGAKKDNPWAQHVPPEQLQEPRSLELLGVEVARRKRQMDLSRPFVARFGDIKRIEARGRDLVVSLKSGTVIDLDRFGSDDFADGLRVWDPERGALDLDEWRVRTVDLLPTPQLTTAPDRLHGTVRTQRGDFYRVRAVEQERGRGLRRDRGQNGRR